MEDHIITVLNICTWIDIPITHNCNIHIKCSATLASHKISHLDHILYNTMFLLHPTQYHCMSNLHHTQCHIPITHIVTFPSHTMSLMHQTQYHICILHNVTFPSHTVLLPITHNVTYTYKMSPLHKTQLHLHHTQFHIYSHIMSHLLTIKYHISITHNFTSTSHTMSHFHHI